MSWYCPLPFNHIYCDTRGDFRTCCFGDKTNINIKDTSIDEWRNSDILKNIQKEMLDKNSKLIYCSKYCSKCMTQEENNIISKREKAKTNGLDVKLRIFGNECNLSCYMCTPINSTRRLKDVKNIDSDYFSKSEILNRSVNLSDERFTEILDEIVSLDISSLKIIGGEPLIMTRYYDLLEKLIKCDKAKNIELNFQTNLTISSKKLNRILSNFKKSNVIISLDSMEKYNDYIRFGSDWDEIMNNFENIMMTKNVNVTMNSTVSLLSIFHLDELLAFANEEKLRFNVYQVNHPEYLNVKHMPEELKNKLIHKYKAYPDIINMLKQNGNNELFKKGLKYCIELDEIHGTNLFEIFPELKDYY